MQDSFRTLKVVALAMTDAHRKGGAGRRGCSSSERDAKAWRRTVGGGIGGRRVLAGSC
jgi:hypothetical protein